MTESQGDGRRSGPPSGSPTEASSRRGAPVIVAERQAGTLNPASPGSAGSGEPRGADHAFKRVLGGFVPLKPVEPVIDHRGSPDAARGVAAAEAKAFASEAAAGIESIPTTTDSSNEPTRPAETPPAVGGKVEARTSRTHPDSRGGNATNPGGASTVVEAGSPPAVEELTAQAAPKVEGSAAAEIRPKATTTDESGSGLGVVLTDVNARGGMDIVEHAAVRAAQQKIQRETSGWMADYDIRREKIAPASRDDASSFAEHFWHKAQNAVKKTRASAVTTADIGKATVSEMRHHPIKMAGIAVKGILQPAIRGAAERTEMAKLSTLELHELTQPMQEMIQQQAKVFVEQGKEQARAQRHEEDGGVLRKAMRRTSEGVAEFYRQASQERTKFALAEDQVVKMLRGLATMPPDGQLSPEQQAFLDTELGVKLVKTYRGELTGLAKRNKDMLETAEMQAAMGADPAVKELKFEYPYEKARAIAAEQGKNIDDMTPEERRALLPANERKLSEESKTKAEFIDGLQGLTMDALAGNFSGVDAQTKIHALLQELGIPGADLSGKTI